MKTSCVLEQRLRKLPCEDRKDVFETLEVWDFSTSWVRSFSKT